METSSRSAASPSGSRRSDRSTPSRSLPRSFYQRECAIVARDLLGCRLISEVDGIRVEAEIVETEAYVGPDDEASHAHRRFGITPRNRPMFGPPGIAYVYRIYGMHWCLNTVTGDEGFGAAVLLRAARPLSGLHAARERRMGKSDRDLMRGPANLCRALGVDGTLNYHDLALSPLWIEPGEPVPDDRVVIGPRVGISRAVDDPLRFSVLGSEHVSGKIRRPFGL